VDQGTIVLLNGTSSSGKTSLARALQGIMERPFVHTGIDHFLSRVPQQCFDVADAEDAGMPEYFLLVYAGGATRVVGEKEEGESVYSEKGRLVEVRIGPGGLRLLAGMYRSIAALAAAGVDVVVDDCIYDQRVRRAAVTALRDSTVLFVGLRLPLEVAEQRERKRGDRGPGGAAAFNDLVHAHTQYDLEVDTAINSSLACALQVQQALNSGHPLRTVRDLARLMMV
jgi:chloramphenicol 3-O phosphotransferase